jgi:hypothetical protein
MTCEQLTENFDDYMDGELDACESDVLDEHLAACDTCANSVRRERRIRDVMRLYAKVTVPQRDDAWFDHAVSQAAVAGAKHEGRTTWFRGFASAAVIAVALWGITSILSESPSETIPQPVPAVSMTLDLPQTVNLVFSSETEMKDATLRLQLPPGIRLEGFEGQRQIAWTTALRAGKNVLPLRLVATSRQGGVVLATLRHESEDRAFRLVVDVT